MSEVLGCDCGFAFHPFYRDDPDEPAPADDAALVAHLRGFAAEDGDVVAAPGCVQILTEDDGEGGAVYFFDERFLRDHAPLAAYLLHEDWRLPTGVGGGGFEPSVRTRPLTPGGDGPGATWFVPMEAESKYPLDDLDGWGGYRIDGVRLPDLARHLCAVKLADEADGYSPGRLLRLPAFMFAGLEPADRTEAGFVRAVRAAPAEVANWAAWADWRRERGEAPPGVALLRDAFARLGRMPGSLQQECAWDENFDTACRLLLEDEKREQVRMRPVIHSLIQADEHAVFVCLDVSWQEGPYFNQFAFFDDVWASAHPDLANGLLRFAARWDVLTPEPPSGG